MKPEIEELLKGERSRLRKVAELKSVLAMLGRLTPRDEKLIAMAEAELRELAKGSRKA